jgi:hypothetical protein
VSGGANDETTTVYDDRIRRMLDDAGRRVENAEDKGDTWANPTSWPTPHRHYNDVRKNDCGHDLNVGWLELGQEAENAQQLLDQAGIPDGDPQGKGDLDWRVAEAVIRLTEAKARLASIATAHRQGEGPTGAVSGCCVECMWTWPCSTYRRANGDT